MDESAILSAILADLRDPTPRLALSEWIEEQEGNGRYDAGRGEAERISAMRELDGVYVVQWCVGGRDRFSGKNCLWWHTESGTLSVVAPAPDGVQCDTCKGNMTGRLRWSSVNGKPMCSWCGGR